MPARLIAGCVQITSSTRVLAWVVPVLVATFWKHAAGKTQEPRFGHCLSNYLEFVEWLRQG